MDSTPRVQVSGMDDPPPNTQNTVDTGMTPAPSAGNEGQAEPTQDTSLPDAQPAEVEPQPVEEPQPPKMIHFLE